AVVAALEPERVRDVAAPGRRVERAVAAEQVDHARLVGVAGLGQADLDTAARPRPGGGGEAGGDGGASGVAGHEHDLVVGVDGGVGVGADERGRGGGSV